ncbi:mitochondrial 54S ribosomal protein uL4m YML6 [Sporobolomyces salmoneus]|uniref:mitochondrial 54S ribosomal protein uL4m YML6 n=1 Tax=Sporobolomyces salmoneus TaxID=183962 RepID=UPI003177D1C6
MSFFAATRRAFKPSSFASTSRALATAAEPTTNLSTPIEPLETSSEPTPASPPPLPRTPAPSALDAFVHVPLESFYPKHSDPSLNNPSERMIVPLPAPLFNVPSRPSLLHKIVVAHLSALRAGTASTKNRAEVNFSGKKIRPQKGTGHARLGSRGSPMLKGGGRAFGPRPKGPDGWKRKINRKEEQLGLRVSLSEKWRAGNLAVVEKLGLDVPSTRTLKEKLTERGWTNALFVTGNSTNDQDERARWAFELSSGNLPDVAVVTDVFDMSVWDIVKRRNVIIDLEAVDDVISRIDPDGPWLEQEWEDLEEGEYEFDGEEEVGDLAERQALEEVASAEVRV